jgi:hypothetical protein
MFNDLKFEVLAWTSNFRSLNIKKTDYDVGNPVPCLDLKLQIIKHKKDYDI